MSPLLVSLMFAVGATTWVYTKFQKTSGNNTNQSIIAASVSGILIFLLFYFVSSSIIK